MKRLQALAAAAIITGLVGLGMVAGTDSPLATTLWMYAGTTLVIVFLTTYRIAIYRIHLPSKRRDNV